MSVKPRLTSLLLKPTKGPRLPVLMFGTAHPQRTPPLLKGFLLRCCTTEWSLRVAVSPRGSGTLTVPRPGTATPRLMRRTAKMGLAKFVWTQMGSGWRKQVGDRLGGTQSAHLLLCMVMRHAVQERVPACCSPLQLSLAADQAEASLVERMTQKPLSKKQGKLQKKALAANRHGKVVKNRKGNVAAAPKKAFLKASFQEDKASLLICIHRGMAAAASRCMLAASMPLNAPLVLDMVAMAEASRCTVLSEVWCSEHLLCIRTCDGVTYACSLPATLLHLHDLTSTMYPWTVQNLTSAINKKNEERTAARVANTGKVLRTAQGDGDAADSPSKAGMRRQPAQDETERAQRRREGNRKASERLRQKQKARLVGLEGRCSELEAANTAAQQQVTSLLNVCQCVLQQNALLQQQLRHVLAGVQRSPAAGVAAAAQVAAMLAQQSALGAAPGAMAPPMPDGAWPGMPPLRPEQLPAAPSVPAARLPRGLPLQPPAMGDMGQQLPGTHPAIAQAAVQGLPEGQPWAPFGAAGPLPMAHAMMINASQGFAMPASASQPQPLLSFTSVQPSASTGSPGDSDTASPSVAAVSVCNMVCLRFAALYTTGLSKSCKYSSGQLPFVAVHCAREARLT
eukprot:jgi/Astpho2/5049/Aster-05971